MNAAGQRPLVPLGDVLIFRNEVVHPRDNTQGQSTFVGLEHIEPHTGRRIGAEQIELSEMTGRRARFRDGDIVYGYLRPYLNKVWIAEFEGLCSVDQYVFSVRSGIDRNYVAHFLRSAEFLRTAPVDSAPGQLPRIRSGEVSETPIPLPPLPEQRRIAAILDEADALRRKRKRTIELLDSLMQSIFLEMFGDPKTGAASKWPAISFSQACEDRTARSGKVQSSNYLKRGKYPVVDQGQNFIAGYVDDPTKVNMLDRPIVVFGDHTRAVKYVDFDFVVGADGAKVLRPRDQFDPLFFSCLLHLMPIPDLGYSRHMRALKELPFWNPPLDLQQRFAERVREIKKQESDLKRSLLNIHLLLLALQHRAFSGEL